MQAKWSRVQTPQTNNLAGRLQHSSDLVQKVQKGDFIPYSSGNVSTSTEKDSIGSRNVACTIQELLLSKGLSFCPASKMNWFQLELDLQHFFRRLKLKVWFNDSNNITEPVVNTVSYFSLKKLGIQPKSDFTPFLHAQPLDMYIDLVQQEIAAIRKNHETELKHPNMTHDEIVALRELTENTALTIKPADKGGGIVVMNTTDYIKEAHRQLMDIEVYQRLARDPRKEYEKKISDILTQALDEGVIDKNMKEYLKVTDPRTPALYLLPKIHKRLVDPPGRPIVSGCGSIFNTIAIFLDKVLRRFAVETTSYIQDTMDFLDKIRPLKIPERAIIGSFDIISLYTSIEHEVGLRAVEKCLTNSEYNTKECNFILTLLELVLTNNYFQFQEQFYLQLRGTAMGANMAPTYANIVVAMLERDHIYVSSHAKHLAKWLRYIDDVFFIWTGTMEELIDFHGFLNQIDNGIKFTMSVSENSVSFLDTVITITGDQLTSSLYCKPTDRNTLLHFNSAHPRSMIESLPYSQLLRVGRVVTTDKEVESTLNSMCNKFQERGYPRRLVEKHKKRVLHNIRGEGGERQEKQTGRRIPFVATYCETSPKIAKTINKYWPILQQSYNDI